MLATDIEAAAVLALGDLVCAHLFDAKCDLARLLRESLGVNAIEIDIAGGPHLTSGRRHGRPAETPIIGDGSCFGTLRWWERAAFGHLAEHAQALAEYLGAATAAQQRRMELLGECQNLLELVSSAKLGCVMFDLEGWTIFATPRAQRMLSRTRAMTFDGAHLRHLPLAPAIGAAVKKVLDDGEVQQGLCWRDQICIRYRATPLENGCVLVLRDASRDRRIDWCAARTRYGLSIREEEVARLIVAGRDRLLASQLRVAESTARTHTRNLYRKLGVHGRAQVRVRLYELRST